MIILPFSEDFDNNEDCQDCYERAEELGISPSVFCQEHCPPKKSEIKIKKYERLKVSGIQNWSEYGEKQCLVTLSTGEKYVYDLTAEQMDTIMKHYRKIKHAQKL